MADTEKWWRWDGDELTYVGEYESSEAVFDAVDGFFYLLIVSEGHLRAFQSKIERALAPAPASTEDKA